MGLKFGPIFKGQSVEDCLILEEGTGGLSPHVGKYQSTLRNIAEERRSHLHLAENRNETHIKTSVLFMAKKVLLRQPSHSTKRLGFAPRGPDIELCSVTETQLFFSPQRQGRL